MWVVYRKSDRKVVGVSADVDVDADKDKALQEIVKGLVESQDVSLYDAYQVKERGKGQRLAEALARGQLKVQDSKDAKAPGGLELAQDTPDISALVVTTNAKDFHPVDKVALLPGDGQSFLVVSIQKTDDQGKPLTRKTKDNDTIWLRTSAGTLREDPQGGPPPKNLPPPDASVAPKAAAAAGDATGGGGGGTPAATPREIRSVQLASGVATFRIYSENLRRLATVHLLPTDPNQRGVTVQVEFT